jgi:hypothetical protein
MAQLNFQQEQAKKDSLYQMVAFKKGCNKRW